MVARRQLAVAIPIHRCRDVSLYLYLQAARASANHTPKRHRHIFLADATGGASGRPAPQVRLPRPTWGAAFNTLARVKISFRIETISFRYCASLGCTMCSEPEAL